MTISLFPKNNKQNKTDITYSLKAPVLKFHSTRTSNNGTVFICYTSKPPHSSHHSITSSTNNKYLTQSETRKIRNSYSSLNSLPPVSPRYKRVYSSMSSR